MRVALIQHDVVWEDAAATRARVRPLLERAARAGAGLAVLPEMFAVGFSMRPERIAESPDGPTATWLAETAAALDLAVIAGVAVRAGGRFENHALAVDAAGRALARYAKIHPFSLAGEPDHYAAGRDPVVFPLGRLTFGLAICYDLRFPELFRRLTRLGAGVLVVLASWPRARVDHWSGLLRARAVENVAYVIGVNRTGEGGGLAYPGAAAAIDPAGTVLVEGGDREDVLLAEISAGRLLDARARFPFLSDVREDLFPDLFGGG